MFPKSKAFRSPMFMAFAHRKPGNCCICETAEWTELHHFGDDGGKGLKPSDNEVARVCKDCHMKNDFKRRALIKQGSLRSMDILDALQNDALKLNRLYIEYLETMYMV